MKDEIKIKLSLLLFIAGFVGIVSASIHSTFLLAKELFIASSFMLASSLLVYLFINVEKNTKTEYVFLAMLFLVSIVKVIGIHLKYGIYMGADSFLEHDRIQSILSFQHITFGGDLAKIPLSMIYVVIVSMFTGVGPLFGSFNFVHLVTSALIPVGAYILIRNSFDTKIAIVSAFILAYHPTNTVLGLSMTRENLALLFLMLGMILIMKQLKKHDGAYLAVFSVLGLGLILSHYTTAFFSTFILSVVGLALIVFHLKDIKSDPKCLVRFSTPLIFFAIFYNFIKSGQYPGQIYATSLIGSAIEFLSHNSIVLLVFLLGLGYLTVRKPLVELIKRKPKQVLLIAAILLLAIMIAWLKMAMFFNLPKLHYQSMAILTGTSFVDILYKIYALFFIAGTALLIWEMAEKRISKEQGILAVVGIFSVLLAAMWAFSKLSISLEPHRALRFSAMIGSLVAAFFTVDIYKKMSTERAKLAYTAFILMVFAYPITAYVADYLAFYSDTYPSKLHDNMYNIRSLNEIMAFSLMNDLVPENSTIIVEFNRGQGLLSSNPANVALMNKEMLLAPTENSYLFLRKSLLKYKQYIQYPEGSYFLTPPQVVELTDEEFNELKTLIAKNNVIYSHDGYMLVQVEGS